MLENDAARAILRRPAGTGPSPHPLDALRGDGSAVPSQDLPLARALRSGATTREAEFEIVRGDGSRATICVDAGPVRDERGEIIGAVMSFSDITARRRLEAGRRFLAKASEVLASSLEYAETLRNVARLAVPVLGDWCTVDLIREDGQVERLAVEHVDPDKAALARELARSHSTKPEAHPTVSRVLGGGKAELIPELTDELLRSIAGTPENLRILTVLGARSAMLVPLCARGRVLGSITLVSGESGRVFTSEDLALAEELALHAGQAIDNARLYDESQAANRTKADFLSVISHELRTPLTAVIGYAELLALGIPEPVTERQGEQVERIEIAARHLLRLIEEILTITNLEAGTISVRREVVQLSELMARAEAIARPLAEEKGLTLELEMPEGDIVLESDSEKLLQVLVNLLSNGVKFTDSGSVRLRARSADGWVELAVIDTGIGLDRAHRRRLFETFWQAEQPITRRVGGTGLGLAISGRLIKLLGGEIDVHSERGAGSTFTARIPLRPVEALRSERL